MERQFKGVWIPAAVWLNPELTAIEKMIYSEVESFTGRGATFFKSNESIATEMGVSLSTVKRSLSGLIAKGYIIHLRYDGRVRHLQSCEPSDGSNRTYQSGHIEPISRVKSTHQEGHIEPVSKQVSTQSKSPPKIEVPLGFESEDFGDAWKLWKDYKAKEHGFKYKSPISEQTTIQKLHNDTQGDTKHAILAIGNAIARGWKGIYPQSSDTSERDNPVDPSRALGWASS